MHEIIYYLSAYNYVNTYINYYIVGMKNIVIRYIHIKTSSNNKKSEKVRSKGSIKAVTKLLQKTFCDKTDYFS